MLLFVCSQFTALHRNCEYGMRTGTVSIHVRCTNRSLNTKFILTKNSAHREMNFILRNVNLGQRLLRKPYYDVKRFRRVFPICYSVFPSAVVQSLVVCAIWPNMRSETGFSLFCLSSIIQEYTSFFPDQTLVCWFSTKQQNRSSLNFLKREKARTPMKICIYTPLENYSWANGNE